MSKINEATGKKLNLLMAIAITYWLIINITKFKLLPNKNYKHYLKYYRFYFLPDL